MLDIFFTRPVTCSIGEYKPAFRYSSIIWLNFTTNSSTANEEGTVGKFPVHLHFAIYIYDQDGNEETVNSYLYLRKIDEE